MHNLFRLSSRSSLEGYFYKPRMDKEILAEHSGGLIVSTGCPSGALQTRLRLGQWDEAVVPIRWERYAWALGTTLVCTAVAFAMYPHFELANIVMAYVLGSTVAGVRFGRGPASVAAIANVIAFDFCFVPPRYTFSVADFQYLVTFAVMLIVTMVIANLMASVRQQTRVAGARERRTASLYAMSRELAATRGVGNMARVAVRHVAEVFDCSAVVLLPDANGKLQYPHEPPMEGSLQHADLSIAQWVVDHGRRAGLGSDTLPAAPALYVPLSDDRQHLGVLAVLPANRRRILLPEQLVEQRQRARNFGDPAGVHGCRAFKGRERAVRIELQRRSGKFCDRRRDPAGGDVVVRRQRGWLPHPAERRGRRHRLSPAFVDGAVRIEPGAQRIAPRAAQDLAELVDRHLEDHERIRPQQGRFHLGLMAAAFARGLDYRAEAKVRHARRQRCDIGVTVGHRAL